MVKKKIWKYKIQIQLSKVLGERLLNYLERTGLDKKTVIINLLHQFFENEEKKNN